MAEKKEKRIAYPPEVQQFVVDHRKLNFSYPEIYEMLKKKLPKESWEGLSLTTMRGIGYRVLGRTGHPQGRNTEKRLETKAHKQEAEAAEDVIQKKIDALKDRGYSPSHISEFLKEKFGVLKTAAEINRMTPKGVQIRHPEIGLDWGKDLEFVQINIKVPVKQAAKALLALFGGYI